MTSETDQGQRRIEYLPLEVLARAADPANPKAHDLPTLTESVDRFGFVEPVVVDERTGRLVSGHGRVAALAASAELGGDPPDGVQRASDGSWLVPAVVGWSSRSDAEARAALVALNRTGETGGWDSQALLSLLEGLTEVEGGLFGVGFGADEVEALSRQLSVLDAQALEFDEDPLDDPDDPDEGLDESATASGFACPACGYRFDEPGA